MADLKEYAELFEKLKGGEVVVPQSREEAFRLAFLNAMSGGTISMDRLELTMETNMTSMPSLIYEFTRGSAVVYNNEIHILGCNFMGTNHYKYDGSTWTEVSTLPYVFNNGLAVVYNNEIHILGGRSGEMKHYKYDGSTWTEVSTLPYAFYNGSAVVYNDEIHILGGVSNYKGVTKHYKWNGSTWIKLSDLHNLFNHGSAVVYNNEIHILGGEYGSRCHYRIFNSIRKLYTIKESKN